MAGTGDAIPAEQEIGPLQAVDWSVLHHRGCIRGEARRWSCVFTTPYAPTVRTPTQHVLTNPLVGHAKTTTKTVNSASTAAQVSVREIMTNHGVTLSLLRIRTV